MPTSRSSPARRKWTWIWSDLHLSDPSVLLGWGRPFPSVEEMNWHLLRNWRRRVDASDTVICLGDVAHPDAWRDDRLVLDLAERLSPLQRYPNAQPLASANAELLPGGSGPLCRPQVRAPEVVVAPAARSKCR